jgi:hypothetical protein
MGVTMWIRHQFKRTIEMIDHIPQLQAGLEKIQAERLNDRQIESERRIVALEVKIDSQQAEILRRLDRIERALDSDR